MAECRIDSNDNASLEAEGTYTQRAKGKWNLAAGAAAADDDDDDDDDDEDNNDDDKAVKSDGSG